MSGTVCEMTSGRIISVRHLLTTVHHGNTPKSKVHGANMGPIWGRQDSGGPHVGPMNFAIWDHTSPTLNYTQPHTVTSSGCFHVEHTLELEKMPLWHKNYFLLSHKKTWRKHCSRVQMCDTNHLHLQGLNWSVTSQLSSTTYKTCPPTRVQWILVRIPRKVYGPLTRYVKLRVAKLAIWNLLVISFGPVTHIFHNKFTGTWPKVWV